MEDIILQIREYLKIINKDVSTIDAENDNIIDFIIEDTVDRVLLYLNMETLPTRLTRVLASIVNTGINNAMAIYEAGKNADETAISSISDNGQSVSYSSNLKTIYGNMSDNDLFKGFTPMLQRYRRVNIGNTKII